MLFFVFLFSVFRVLHFEERRNSCHAGNSERESHSLKAGRRHAHWTAHFPNRLPTRAAVEALVAAVRAGDCYPVFPDAACQSPDGWAWFRQSVARQRSDLPSGWRVRQQVIHRTVIPEISRRETCFQ